MGGKVVFKEYDPDQLTFLPYKLEELVPAGHPVRIVKQVVDQVDVKPINRKYKGGGSIKLPSAADAEVAGLRLSDQYLFLP